MEIVKGMIPKKIHYCWFGKNEMDDRIQQYIKTWRSILKDYEFIMWDETNFDLNMCQFTKEAYASKKYAFVSDVVRLYALYEQGGIYLDTDVEIVRSLDPFLDKELLLGYDNPYVPIIATCLLGAEKGNALIKHILDIYQMRCFILDNGEMALEPNTLMFSNEFEKFYGLRLINNNKTQDIMPRIQIYPAEVFHAYDLVSGKVYRTENTVAIHWHSLLWTSWKTSFIRFFRQRVIVPVIGAKNYLKIVQRIKR